MAVCPECGNIIIPSGRSGCPKTHCSLRCADRARGYKYRHTAKGRLTKKRYAKSGIGVLSRKRYESTDSYKAAKAKAMDKYLHTEKGKAYLKKCSGNNEFYRNRCMRWIYIDGRGCAKCGETVTKSLQCDHVVCRALWKLLNIQGDVHGDSNLQILCKKCHRLKTIQDIHEIKLLEPIVCGW